MKEKPNTLSLIAQEKEINQYRKKERENLGNKARHVYEKRLTTIAKKISPFSLATVESCGGVLSAELGFSLGAKELMLYLPQFEIEESMKNKLSNFIENEIASVSFYHPRVNASIIPQIVPYHGNCGDSLLKSIEGWWNEEDYIADCEENGWTMISPVSIPLNGLINKVLYGLNPQEEYALLPAFEEVIALSQVFLTLIQEIADKVILPVCQRCHCLISHWNYLILESDTFWRNMYQKVQGIKSSQCDRPQDEKQYPRSLSAKHLPK